MHGLAWLVLGPLLAMAATVAAQAVPPTCPSNDTALCDKCRNCGRDHKFTVQGGLSMHVRFEDTKYLIIQCEKTNAETPPLEERSVPVFKAGLLVRSVTLEGCPTSQRSYDALFKALNVTFPSDQRPRLSLDKLRGGVRLTRDHFANLSTFAYLDLHDVGPLSVAFLRDLPLKRLLVADSTILQSEFESVSKSFEENSTLANISLRNTTVSHVPAAVLALPALHTLKVLESGSVVLARPPAGATSALRTLHVDAADEEVMSAWAPPAAVDVTLVRWAARRPRPVPACARLKYLTVKSPRATELPARWVAACPLLERLEVKLARNISELPATLLANATSLTTFLFTKGALASLPVGLFSENRKLTSIDLTDNHLQTLPSGVFYYQRHVLRELRLGSNRLGAAVLAAGLGELPALTTLVLAHNTDITDNCGGQPIREGIFVEHKGESGLTKLSNLTYLDLKNTSIRVICKDWRVLLTKLKTLDLSYTKINRLTSEDLQFSWSDVDERSVVRLEHTPLAELEYGPAHYWADNTTRRGERRVRLTLGGPEARLPCDCNVYWPAAALLDGVGPLRLARDSASLWCNATTAHELDRPYIDTLLCERQEHCDAVPAACRCGIRTMLADTTLLHVDCSAAGLDTVPRLESLPKNVTVELLLADNSITELQLKDLPPNIKSFDLRNNTLVRVEEKAALALLAAAARGGGVLLAGGRLACDCGAAAALRVLLRLQPRPRLTCDTGEPVHTALAALRCEEPSAALAPAPPPGAVLGTILGVVALLAVLGGMLFAHPATRRRLKEVLSSLSISRFDASIDEKSPQFDLFLTFGAGCEREALEVVARLEPHYVVCVQERDWVPPARLATCLAASVAASRRTLALASAQWAAALDEQSAEGAALAAALRSRRLLAVLLEPPPAGALRRYLARHPRAALHYADPDFWQKLSAALPAPAPPSPPSPPDRADVGSNV